MKTKRIPPHAPKPPAAPRERKPVERVLPLKKASVTALLELDAGVRHAAVQYQIAQQRLNDRLGAIFTEQGIEQATVIALSEKPPYSMTVRVTKAARKEG
jgi:hypothetical protein